MYKSKLIRNIVSTILTLSLVGAFAIPTTTQAGFTQILADLGFGSGSVSGSYNSGYSSYNNLSSQHQGDIQVSKQVRDTSKGSDFHQSITVRSGALVQVWIQVKNTSSKFDAEVYVTDQIGGSSVYVPNSLTVNGSAVSGSLTSGGLRIPIARKSNVVITYAMNVCSDYGYAATASAYAAGVGSSTDATAITTNQVQSYGYSDFTGTCLNSFQQASYSNAGSNSGVNYSNPFGGWTGVNSNTTSSSSANPFGDWSGVNSNTTSAASSNPFGGWTGVNSNTSSSSTSTNPFGDWSGVNSNASGTSSSNPFGNWTGVNSNNTSNNSSNPFGDWRGVNSNGSGSSSSSSNPFGNWTGVNNSNSNGSASSSNPFGDWSGVNSNTSSPNTYSASDYSNNTNTTVSYADAGNPATGNTGTTNTTGSQAYQAPATTNYVAPTTGVDKFAPIWFATLLTMAFLAYRKRKWLFN